MLMFPLMWLVCNTESKSYAQISICGKLAEYFFEKRKKENKVNVQLILSAIVSKAVNDPCQ